MEVAIENNRPEGRFEIICEEHLAFLEYKKLGDVLVLVHTEVPEPLGGKGIGSQLVKSALEFAVQNGLNIDAQCEFAQGYIKRHREYMPLLIQE